MAKRLTVRDLLDQRGKHQFAMLRVETLDEQPLTISPLVRINSYQGLPPLPAGSRITLVSSLKPAHGLAKGVDENDGR